MIPILLLLACLLAGTAFFAMPVPLVAVGFGLGAIICFCTACLCTALERVRHAVDELPRRLAILPDSSERR